MRREYDASPLTVGLQGLFYSLVFPAPVDVNDVWSCISIRLAKHSDMLSYQRIVIGV